MKVGPVGFYLIGSPFFRRGGACPLPGGWKGPVVSFASSAHTGGGKPLPYF